MATATKKKTKATLPTKKNAEEISANIRANSERIANNIRSLMDR